MTVCHLDFESYSACDLTACGLYKYAEDPSTEILCACFAFDDEEVQLWRPALDDPCPERLVNHIKSGGTVAAHNFAFERVISNSEAARRVGFPPLSIAQGRCTAVKAASNGIPRSLSDVSKALGTAPKDDTGRISMLQLSKPRKPTKADPSTRWTLENAPEKFEVLWRYCADDVRAEREIDLALPDISEREQKLYEIDASINDYGWLVDIKLVNDILYVVEQYKEQLAAEFAKLTEDWLGNGLQPGQREKVSEWVRANGFPELVDLTADYVRKTVKRDDVPPNVKRVLLIYSTYGSKAVSKLQTMLDMACADGRLRGLFQFYGAATGRWSSTGVQLQNILRALIKDVDLAIEAFGSRDIELIRMLWPDIDPIKIAGSCVRGCLIAAPGCDLIFPDYSGIEDRVNAWFFDEQWVLDAYRAFDKGEGRHLYSITVCSMFGFDLATFSDEDPRRQWGKVIRLFMGYEGGVSAFLTGAENYGFDLEAMAKDAIPLLSEEALSHAKWMRENHPCKERRDGLISEDVETACNGFKFLYRQSHPRIKQGWRDLKEAAEKAVEFPGEAFWLPNKKIAFKVMEYGGRKWLGMRLPSGRIIKYYNPRWVPPRESERWLNNELVPFTIPGEMRYWGTDTYTRQWMELSTYGGKLDENADQAFSRDILGGALIRVVAAGYRIVGSEHDKIVVEAPHDFGSVDEVKALMVQDIPADLPMTVDGSRRSRYGK